MAEAAYDGIFGYGYAWLFTPTTGTPFGSTQAQVEEANTPPVTIETAKYTPISGANSNVEQFALGRYPVKEYKMKVTYSAAAHAAALVCLAARVKGSLVCTYGDGSTETYAGSAITEVSAGPNTAQGLRTAEITVTTPVPPVFSAGTAITVVQTTKTFTTSGTIDLSGAPYSGNGKTPIRMFLQNLAANANNITVVFGASNPYIGFGAAFNITLKPGESCQLDGGTTIATGSACNLDVSGTGTLTLVVQVQLQ